MDSFLLWFLLVSLLGWLTFPLAYRLLPALADRGYGIVRALALLLWGFLFWIAASLGIVQNDPAGLLLPALVLVLISLAGFARGLDWREWTGWLKANRRLLLTTELVFLLAFAFLAFVRAGNPEIAGTEKPMELAFINAILRSQTFPPHDPWLSGYAISYYYFGYVLAAMLAKLTGTVGSVAFNLMLALTFALCASGAYSLVYNLLSARSGRSSRALTRLPLLGPLFLLLVSNFEGLLELLYARHWFWKTGAVSSAFWKWIDLLDLRDPPAYAPSWMPQRYYWWWRASRVLTEYNLSGSWHEIIDEFPFFSYLLGDLHPHVLAMPFLLLVLGLAWNLFQGGWKGETHLGLYRLKLSPAGLVLSALALGGLAFLNLWDILLGFGLLVGAYSLARIAESGWGWKRLLEAVGFGLPLGALALLFYLPFYAGFSSQAGGFLPNLENPTRGVHLWIMFGPLFLVLTAFFLFLARRERLAVRWRTALLLSGGLTLLLWVLSWLLGVTAQIALPGFVAAFLGEQNLCTGAFFLQAFLRRLSFVGGAATILGLLAVPLGFLIPRPERIEPQSERKEAPLLPAGATAFVLFLVLLGGLLVLAPEYVFLRDGFGNRMNTIFKFYYQAWLLFSLSAAFSGAVLLHELSGRAGAAFRVGLALVLFGGLLYPVMGLSTKTETLRLPAFLEAYRSGREAGDEHALRTAASVWTLDGGALYDRIYPDDMAAARWLRSAPYGTIVEAIIPGEGYSDYGHISEYSGLPTVLGWEGHEAQWRGSYEPQGTRHQDIERLYQTRSWEEASQILEQYGIRYVFVGTLERQTYLVDEAKFQQHLPAVFQSGQVAVYEVP